MKIYISGVMQGSIKGEGIQEQGYRPIITDGIRVLHPDAEIFDPRAAFPDSPSYDDDRAKEALFFMADEAASSDIVIAYLPEASMGTALEMIRAYDNGKTVITITSLEKNWFIKGVSAKIFSSLDEFVSWIEQTDLSRWIRKTVE
jgi:hypothetical protein